ncbi:MAG: XRE family transcriptional regulator [Paracoccaceae bacterium]
MRAGIILNEKELSAARMRVAALDEALATDESLKRAVAGLPPEVFMQLTASMKTERNDLAESIQAYVDAKEARRPALLENRAGDDPGLMLIVARIAKGYTQRDLAWRLGVKEQQIQRYEADRYRTISVKNYSRVAALLGVRLAATIEPNLQFRGLDKVIDDVSKEGIKKILKHGRANGWFTEDMDEFRLRQYIAENRIDFGSPTLLRTGLNVQDHSEDVLLHAWRARVLTRAKEVINAGIPAFEPINTGWLHELPKLSVLPDGPLRAKQLLHKAGIVFIAERQIPGLTIDGAAFVEANVPVIGLTLRKDDIGNFWFSLLHEVGHVVLHRLTGLANGFFDQFDASSVDEQEAEADAFASNMLIPEERWRKSTARIAKTAQPAEKLAKELGINPAIVFGRIQKERDNYALFSKKIGRNTMRKLLIEQPEENKDAALSSGAKI